MGRFILLWVPDGRLVKKVTKKVAKWQEKIPIKIVGEFMDPQSFCDKSCGRQTTEGWQKTHPSITHPLWGTIHCPLCKKVIRYTQLNLRNAMDIKLMTAPYASFRLIMNMPPDNSPYNGRSPEEIHGQEVIDEHIENKRRTAQLIKEHKAGAESRAATRRRRRARRNTNGV